jgi:hypothetical protein
MTRRTRPRSHDAQSKDQRDTACRLLWSVKDVLGGCMATPAGRTRRPNGIQVTKRSNVSLSDDAWTVIEKIAEDLGVTRDYLMDELILHVGRTLPEDGLPDWWTKPTSKHPAKGQESLPLTA